jgi:hypothetical protein
MAWAVIASPSRPLRSTSHWNAAPQKIPARHSLWAKPADGDSRKKQQRQELILRHRQKFLPRDAPIQERAVKKLLSYL